MTFKVFVDDNFHYADKEERYSLGEFPTLEAAIEAAPKIVNDYLSSIFRVGLCETTMRQTLRAGCRIGRMACQPND